MTLNRRDIGEGPPVAFCHGLFGQGRNWTQIAKSLSDQHRCILLDMPDHGRSDWTDGFDYENVARLVAEELADDGPLALVGHSMGGKIAMLVALRHPEIVQRLCVVDVSPVDYQGITQFNGYVGAMRAMDLSAIGGRGDADEALTEAVPDPVVRGFLLQNLRREGDGWRWQMNLEGLGDHLDELGGWPEQEGTFEGPTLWVNGAESGYVKPEYEAVMREHFPRVRQVTVKNAGHWVHSEQPAVFTEILRRFLDG